MKPKACLACLLVLFILLTAVTACAKKGDQEESQPTSETSPSTRRTQVTTKETEPSPLETETEPSETQESDPSESADPSTEATTQVTSTSSTASTVTLPSYTVTTTEGASFTFPSLTWTSPPTNLSKEYEAIYNDYSDRLKKATPRLIDEYKAEIKTNPDIEKVKEKKIDALSAIAEEGTAKMDKLYQDKDGELLELGEWVGKLGVVYAQELVKLNRGFD